MNAISLSRRSLLAAGGALVVGFAAPGAAVAQVVAGAAKPKRLAPDQLSSWVAIQQNGDVVGYFGKVDLGQGTDSGVALIIAEELDVPFKRVSIVMGDTDLTVNQGGASGSTGLEEGAVTLRYAAAEARRVLLDMAAEKLGVPVAQLSVQDGVVSGGGKSVSYGELIGGRQFEVAMKWNGKIGNPLLVQGQAQPKKVSEYKQVGKPAPRFDVAGKVLATSKYVGDVRLPGMLHGRMIRPPVAGATVVSFDAASVAHLKGVRVMAKGGFLGVVAPKEWDAVRASRELKVVWSDVKPPFPAFDTLHDHIRAAKVLGKKEETKNGDVDAALAAGAPAGGKLITADYEWPFQSHASMAPACALVDVTAEKVTVYTGTQKPHYCQLGVAAILGRKPEEVHAVWITGPGSYGRNDAGDAAIDAALLSREFGAPVRVQGMRHEGTGWDPKGPASVHTGRAIVDANGQLTAIDFATKAFSRVDINSNESDPKHSLAGQMMGLGTKHEPAFGVPTGAYVVANKRLAWESVEPLLAAGSPLRTSHLRDPVGPQLIFAYESFIDEVAHITGQDAIAFRLRHLPDPRAKKVLEAAAEKFGWDTRVSATKVASGEIMRGRGVSYGQRGKTLVAIIAEVEVNRSTGKVQPTRFAVAHNCGLIVNPSALYHTIEGNIIHASSRALHEEVRFDEKNVTSVDWETYPILDITEAPQKIDIVLINDQEKGPYGAGEGSTRPLAGAIGNAIFDATGIRLRRAPFTADRMKAALGTHV